MENAVKNWLQSVQFADAQVYKNIAIVPLVAPAEGTFQYRILGEALATSDVAITEVSVSGSVPDLMVVNRADKPVLLIDGEELAGAKQNRVLNTSILLKEVSETRIPVSCTEQGRWSYASKAFSESGNVMAYMSRSRKTSSVQSFLEASAGHKSNQAEVWANIAELQAKACVASPTSAMSDVYKAREQDLRKCDEIFKPVSNQVGLLVFIGGTPVGADLFSRSGAYAKLHAKLVRSYTLEGLLAAAKPGEGGADSNQETSTAETITTQARQFLDEFASVEERQFPSVGYGTDFRYRLVASKPHEGGSAIPHSIAGTALVHENELIHGAFFRLDDSSARTPQSSTNIASYRSRFRA